MEATSRYGSAPEANIIHSFITSFYLFTPLIPFSMGSLAFARAAHIDLALVPFIGTWIDLENSLCTAYTRGLLTFDSKCGFRQKLETKKKKKTNKQTQKVGTVSSKVFLLASPRACGLVGTPSSPRWLLATLFTTQQKQQSFKSLGKVHMTLYLFDCGGIRCL
ncbi:hypothetical protein M419DRAFT_123719 [Trichoderma reesei RUT C-30]|jgi:hypothetical protein|uniref:Uncharacterized protein n=1 Tax=Hypocrea jecorina (strain ATCC 56765 / BCRC 32924 / NRRL 11460 / Rut C-30) TaxID=1344414 RepID=A0A024S867_HYPJR|nr:hypothetical protein M419DRAFT_123719 [Trichoderma reesei RUT C-30]